ncbi:hypothetical protein [Georgenia sp. H159]|uniref:hypothetical protein n=1 Tax=Georgenia sp. H159 TaxID=3076115 RepID=UPI002D7A242F|nr:hypothetical protein [Georgenia sp. H159]
MSVRRMARVNPYKARRAEVPPELADPDHAVWQDGAEVARLADAYTLAYAEPPRSALRDPAWQRFTAVRRAFCETRGLMSARWPTTLDYGRMRDAGIYAASHSAAYGLRN